MPRGHRCSSLLLTHGSKQSGNGRLAPRRHGLDSGPIVCVPVLCTCVGLASCRALTPAILRVFSLSCEPGTVSRHHVRSGSCRLWRLRHTHEEDVQVHRGPKVLAAFVPSPWLGLAEWKAVSDTQGPKESCHMLT